MTGKTVPDSRRWWRREARMQTKKREYLQADYDAVETELKQLLAERERCTCQARTGGQQ
ncbi:hypothetical protein [Arthrobacter pascens]|uniref:hypothetical protein n=1 Tax=Arthrobacter pascens TaxID=1677 RepID=UPI00196B18CE|nr:hypothetical protein [Arthrobacter pascens]MBN3498601.1 hypothetical protein [Arthrobacter pascens]